MKKIIEKEWLLIVMLALAIALFTVGEFYGARLSAKTIKVLAISTVLMYMVGSSGVVVKTIGLIDDVDVPAFVKAMLLLILGAGVFFVVISVAEAPWFVNSVFANVPAFKTMLSGVVIGHLIIIADEILNYRNKDDAVSVYVYVVAAFFMAMLGISFGLYCFTDIGQMLNILLPAGLLCEVILIIFAIAKIME